MIKLIIGALTLIVSGISLAAQNTVTATIGEQTAYCVLGTTGVDTSTKDADSTAVNIDELVDNLEYSYDKDDGHILSDTGNKITSDLLSFLVDKVTMKVTLDGITVYSGDTAGSIEGTFNSETELLASKKGEDHTIVQGITPVEFKDMTIKNDGNGFKKIDTDAKITLTVTCTATQ